MLTLELVQVVSCWIMCGAKAARESCPSANISPLTHTTVATLKMLASRALVSQSLLMVKNGVLSLTLILLIKN